MPACPRAQSRPALTAAHAAVREPEVASVTEGNFSHSSQVTVSPIPRGTMASCRWLADAYRSSNSACRGYPQNASGGLVGRSVVWTM